MKLKSSILLIILGIWLDQVFPAHWDERISLQTIFDDLKDIYPKNGMMKDILDVHKDFLQLVEFKRYASPSSYNRQYSRYGRRSFSRYSRGYGFDSNEYEGEYEGKQGQGGEGNRRHHITNRQINELKDFSELNIDIHIDVAMIGFPSSTVEFVRDYWFDNLGRKEPIMYTTDSMKHVFTYNSNNNDDGNNSVGTVDVTITYHYHMVRVSFMVADAIRDHLRYFINSSDPITISSNNQPIHIIHSWEIETILNSLRSTITSTHHSNRNHQKSNESNIVTPSATIFILNIHDMIPDMKNYTYCSEFTSHEIEILRKDNRIVNKVKSLRSEETRATRIDRSPERGQMTIQENINKYVAPFKDYSHKHEIKMYSSHDIPESGIHWRDAVQATKEWAKKLNIDTSTQLQEDISYFTLSGRAMKILASKPSHDLYRRKSKLIEAILSNTPLDSKNDVNYCSSLTWVGNDRLLWMDIKAETERMNSETKGEHKHIPLPAPLTQAEWLLLGQSTKYIDVTSEIRYLENNIEQHLSSAISIYKISECPEETLNDVLYAEIKINSRAEYLSNSMYRYTSNHYGYYGFTGYTNGICSHLIGDILYLNVTLETSRDLNELYRNYLDPTTQMGLVAEVATVDVKDLIQEASRLHRRTLAEAYRLIHETDTIDYSSYDQDTSNTKAASVMMSSKAMNYLSRISGEILRLTRYFISPPMILSKSTTNHDMSHNIVNPWIHSLPEILIPTKMDITIYLITLKNTKQKSIIQFDYETLFRELQYLRLGSQEMTLSLQPIDISLEIELFMGLSLCKSQYYDNFGQRKIYLHGDCILKYIQKKDVTSQTIVDYSNDKNSKSSGKSGKYSMPSSSKSKNGINERKSEKSSYSRQSKLQEVQRVHHMPVFVLLVDENEPVVLDNGELAIRIGNAVIVIQNSQSNSITNMPISKTLLSLSEVIAGLPPSTMGHEGLLTTSMSLRDIQERDSYITMYGSILGELDKSYQYENTISDVKVTKIGLGSSPRFASSLSSSVQSTPLFSLLDIDYMHRSRILRMLSVTVTNMRKFFLSLHIEVHHYFQDKEDDRQRASDRIDQFIQKFKSLLHEILIDMSSLEWSSAIEKANAAYLISINPNEYLSIEILSNLDSSPSNHGLDSQSNAESDQVVLKLSLINQIFVLWLWPLIYGIIATIGTIIVRIGIQSIQKVWKKKPVGLFD